MGFSRQEYWSGLPFPSPGESSQPRDRTQVFCIAGRCFNLCATRKAHGRTHMESEIKKSWFYQLSECGEFYSRATLEALATVHRSDTATFPDSTVTRPLRGDAFLLLAMHWFKVNDSQTMAWVQLL